MPFIQLMCSLATGLPQPNSRGPWTNTTKNKNCVSAHRCPCRSAANNPARKCALLPRCQPQARFGTENGNVGGKKMIISRGLWCLFCFHWSQVPSWLRAGLVAAQASAAAKSFIGVWHQHPAAAQAASPRLCHPKTPAEEGEHRSHSLSYSLRLLVAGMTERQGKGA